MHRCVISFVFLFAMSLFAASPCRGDGVSFGDALILSESEQIAAIACRDQGETLLLGTRFMSNAPMQNQVWIVPVFSETEPIVQALPPFFIGDMADFIRSREPEIVDQAYGNRTLGRVTVYDDKELDDYDLSVLKTDSGEELAQWIRDRGYAVPDSVVPLLDAYTSRDAYFIVNRLDLRNRYSRELDFLQSMGYDLVSLNGSDSFSSQFGNIHQTVERAIFADISAPEEIPYDRSVLKGYVGLDDYLHITKLFRENPDKSDPNYQIEFWGLYETLFGNLQRFWDLFGNMLGAGMSKSGYISPIRIDFKPPQCFFPLKISSAAPDRTMTVTVAVLADGKVRDSSNVLKTNSEFQSMTVGDYATNDFYFTVQNNEYADKQFISHFDPEDIAGLQTVTLIVMEARPSDFTADAWFEPLPDTLTAMFDFKAGWNLVGNPFARDLCVQELNAPQGTFYTFDASGDGSWNKMPCLAPCEAGFIFAEHAQPTVELQGQAANQRICRAAFENVIGWRLVARPDIIGSGRIRFGPYSLNPITRHFQLKQDEIPGVGYWVFLDN